MLKNTNFCYLKIQADNQHQTAFWEILDKDAHAKYLIQYYCGDTRVSNRDPWWCEKSRLILCDHSDIMAHYTKYKYQFCS